MSNAPSPPFIRFGRAVCGDLAQAEAKEWWLANGTGAYAAGTIAGTLTRRYHGLLIAPVEPPLGRVLVAAKADARLQLTAADGTSQEFALFANRWADGSVQPQGFADLESFTLEGRLPVWTFRAGPYRLELRIWLEHGAPTTWLAYRLLDADASVRAHIQLALLVDARDHHGNTRRGDFTFEIEEPAAGETRVRQGPHFTLRVLGPAQFTRDAVWYEHFELAVERARGLDDADDHFCVGRFDLPLKPGQWSGLALSLREDTVFDLDGALQRAQRCEQDMWGEARTRVPELGDAPDWIAQLVRAAGAFLIARPLADEPDGASVIAGYPWFGDWGRDTMIALPGLTLATGRFEVARQILRTFARFVDDGLLPNVFPGAGETPQYNTADATLWYVEAWRAYVEASGDLAAAREVWPVLEGIVDAHVAGTRYGIGLDAHDGLLRAGAPGVQLTWMDAKVGDHVITPRWGKPVEINALWFNALRVMTALSAQLGLPAMRYRRLADAAAAGFARFHKPEGGLFDVIDVEGGTGLDGSVRPNQLFAVSLPYSPLDAEVQARVLDECARELLTSYGLRSLSPHDPAYRPRYEGDGPTRDAAYHQGTVWTWLLGHYALAQARVRGDAAAARAVLEPLRDHLSDAGLGTISEIFDAAPPHTARGAPAQAWSVACTLEAWWRLSRTHPFPVARGTA